LLLYVVYLCQKS